MSKSKKHSQRPAKPVEARHPEEDHGLLEDVHVPKGTSRVKFIFILALMIFTLVIFTIGDQLTSTAGPNRGDGVFFSWEHPTRGTIAVSSAAFMTQKQQLRPFSRMSRRRGAPPDSELAIELINDELAREAGVAVTDEELGKAVLEGFEGLAPPFITAQNYTLAMQQERTTKQAYEETLRRKMRVSRYLKLLMTITSVPDPERIEEAWEASHQEYAYDYIAIAHASLEEEAQSDVPDDQALAAWYDELPNKQSLFFADYKPATVTAELVSVPADSEPTGLLERYPPPATEDDGAQASEGDAEEDAQDLPEDVPPELQEEPESIAVDTDAQAQDYFNQFAHTRFRREEPVDSGELETRRDDMLYTFEEKADEARREAPIHAAMQRWLQDMKDRVAAGEEVDLSTEAREMGLDYQPADAARTQADWAALDRLGGPFLGGAMMATPVGQFSLNVVVDPGGPLVLRVAERTEREAPVFVDVRDRVVEEWKKQRSRELAQEKLQALRDDLLAAAEGSGDAATENGEQPAATDAPAITEEAFRAAAEAAGLTVARRDWLELGASNTVDPDYATMAHTFIRSLEGPARRPDAVSLSSLEADRLSEVLDHTGVDGAVSYVFRTVGKRDPTELKINPSELEQLELEAGFAQFADFVERNMSVEAYAERYKLKMVGSDVLPAP